MVGYQCVYPKAGGGTQCAPAPVGWFPSPSRL